MTTSGVTPAACICLTCASGCSSPLADSTAFNGHVETKALVELSANIQVKNDDGDMPLHLAAANGHVDVLKTLLQLSADIQAKAADGSTPLHMAAACSHVETLKTLLQLGAHMGVRAVNGETPLDASDRLGHLG